MKFRKKIVNIRSIARADDWQIIHSSLMTVLMIFFMVMFSIYHLKKEDEYEVILNSIQGGFGGTANVERILEAQYREKEKDVEKEFADSEGLKKFTRIESDRETIKIIFPDPVIFSPGSADLKLETMWLLGEIAEKLRMLPDNKIVIEGHTDNIPISSAGRYSSNWELSLARSLSIVHYMTEVENMNPSNFVPMGYGEYRPLYPNDSPEHRAQNRRIEINIVKKG
ncbi:MAG: flagellar motor protein MotB [Elusimicrobia bacterium]|nr:flagellar motor protein MotB [Elusimicrobiota bacterium]